jgi:hypothetical protein
MKITISTEAGAATVEATIGRVSLNGGSMLPHEAVQLAAQLVKGAKAANAEANVAASDAFSASRE